MRKKSLNNIDKNQVQRSMVYQRAIQKEGSPHYVFLYSDDENSDAEETITLYNRSKSTCNPRKVEVISIQLKPEDTLQALALRFRCTISALKRINKIDKDNEIYAHQYIKVPVQPFSILTESNNKVEITNQPNISILEEPSTSTPVTLIEPPTTVINTIILNSVCKPLTYHDSIVSEDILESDQLLDPLERDTQESYFIDTFKCSGDDCGLSWMHLLGLSLLIVVAGPIIYAYMLYCHAHQDHIPNPPNSTDSPTTTQIIS